MSKLSRRDFVSGISAAATIAVLPRRAGAVMDSAVIPDVLVLGAGLSGLNAARLLEEQGARVRVLEARQRVGGRVFTRFDLPGHPEVGANNMAPGYARTVDASQRLSVELIDYQQRFVKMSGDSIAVGGRSLSRAAWAASPRNPLPANARSQFPVEYIAGVLSKNNPFPDPEAWIAPGSASSDRSVYEVLRSLDASDELIALCYDHNIPYGTSSRDVSALMYWFVDAWGKVQRQFGSAAYAVKGGNQKLPEAMRAGLRGDVLLGRDIVAVNQNEGGVTVVCRDGASFRAKLLVCSLPLPVLGTVAFDPLPPPLLRHATLSLRYMKLRHQYFTSRKAYWKDDGLNPSMWTDGPAGQVFGQRFGNTDDDVTIISSTQRGFLAEYMDRMPASDAARLIMHDIERLRPAAAGALTPVGTHSWSQDAYATGGWVIFGPGQVGEFAGKLHVPHQRIHFCGEHTAISNRGMEGAMESGERAALEVLDRL